MMTILKYILLLLIKLLSMIMLMMIMMKMMMKCKENGCGLSRDQGLIHRVLFRGLYAAPY